MKKFKKRRLEPENPRRMERIILIVYLFHTISLLAVIAGLGWSYTMLIPLLIGTPVLLYLHIKQKYSFEFRAYFTTVLLWINISLYAFHTDDFTGLFTSIGALTLLLALYGLPRVFAIGNAFYTVLILVRLFFIRDISVSLTEQGMRMLTRILSVFLIEALAAYLVHTQQESRRHLLDSIDSLHRSEHSKDDFLANVSHEIRTPVNTICGMSEIVMQSDLPQETYGYLYDIRTAGRNLLSIVSDILDFSELESGEIALLQDDYSISSVVNDIVSTANAKNSEKHLEIIVDCDPGMPSVLIGDRQKICRAIINVIDNAIKFTREGGLVIAIGTRSEKYGVNLNVTVSDTGIGIKPEVLEKIFTSFNQADTRRNRAESGIGLGLAISKAIVNRMGGFLNIQSTYGQGTTVNMVIPQTVKDSAPCIFVSNPEEKRILVYMHLDRNKYALLREGGQTTVKNLATRFDVTAFACRNLAEVKRRMDNEAVTHVFIGTEEYSEDPDYFNGIANKIRLTLIIEENAVGSVPDVDNILCIHAPLYALSVASILNGETVHDMHLRAHVSRFTAPDVHVLVVDDNLMNLKVVEGLLKPYRLKVSTAQSGKEALNKLNSKEYDFVFMDHMMPEMDGVETFRRIRESKDRYHQNVPVIALTANAVGNAREMFMAEGFSDYLSKPIEMSSLEHVLRKFIPKGKIVYEEVRPDVKGISAPTNQKSSMPSRQGGGASEDVPVSVSAVSGAPQTEPAAPVTEADCIAELHRQGIDTKLGIGYCGGNLPDYIDIVRMYYADGEKNINGIRKSLSDGDKKSYVIFTHTVKGTSKSIGAAALSDLARELEAAGKNDEVNLQDMQGRTENMLSEYRRILDALKGNRAVFPDSGKAEEIAETEVDDAQFISYCNDLSGRLDSFDSDAVTEFVKGLDGASYRGRPLTEVFRPVISHAEDFDFMGAGEALNELKESVLA